VSEQLNLIARAEVVINSSVEKAWKALTNPEIIKQYMFDTTVTSDWKKGSKITWQGQWQGKPYEDKGTILEIIPFQKLAYTHFSPLSGLEDKPENYHKVTIELRQSNEETKVTLLQDHNSSEQSKQHSEKNWMMMLTSLKKLLESKSGSAKANK
jgi:uncharacterized protein YndB with AHSA1/START domain